MKQFGDLFIFQFKGDYHHYESRLHPFPTHNLVMFIRHKVKIIIWRLKYVTYLFVMQRMHIINRDVLVVNYRKIRHLVQFENS